MYRNVKDYVDFIAKNKLTQAQFLFLYCIRFHEYEAIEVYKGAFPSEDGSMIGEASKKDLIDREFIKHVGEGNKATDYEITDRFNILFLNNHFVAAQEVWDAYPSYALINGQKIPLTAMDSYAFANLYGERIKYSVKEHLEVMKDVEYGRNHDLLSVKIENFVRGELWTKIRQLRRGEQKVATPKMSDSF